jgi:hypothetical protein
MIRDSSISKPQKVSKVDFEFDAVLEATKAKIHE